MSWQAKICQKCDLANANSENNGNWQGGRTNHSKGYIYIKNRDHPRSGKNGYVFEHILVMESEIGRYLLKGENVHHTNGIRSDNRLENLELWANAQPNGVRVKDAFANALEIIERYEGITLPNRTKLNEFTEFNPKEIEKESKRNKTKLGYVLVNLRNHPKSYSNGTIAEHTLVMEKILGRHLEPGENIHHINGIRHDNRPENLELWTRPQPSGIRASDALCWAKGMIALYS